jgi:hypothetical protein
MAFDFPMDKFPRSYSGMGSEFQGFLTGLLPQVKQTFENLPAQRQGFYDQARTDINQGFDTAISGLGDSYKRTLQPALQNVMNKMGSRNMLNSSVTGDTMAGTARGIGESILDRQANLDLMRSQSLADIARREGESIYQIPQLLTNLLAQGRYSESTDEGAPYRTALGFLQSMMG